MKIVWTKGQIPPGGVDVSLFTASPSPLTFGALTSRSRTWASSLKGLSLYSVCSHSLNCTDTQRHNTLKNKQTNPSHLPSPARPTPDLPGSFQTPAAAAGSPSWGRRKVGRLWRLRGRRSSPAWSPSWCRPPPAWHFGRRRPDCRISRMFNIRIYYPRKIADPGFHSNVDSLSTITFWNISIFFSVLRVIRNVFKKLYVQKKSKEHEVIQPLNKYHLVPLYFWEQLSKWISFGKF